MSILDLFPSDPNPIAQPLPTPPSSPVAAQIPGLSVQGAAPYGMFGMGPLSGGQKLALTAAGLRDALASVQGRPADNFLAQQQQVLMQRRIGAQQGLAQAYASGDPSAIRSARAQAYAAGLDPSQYERVVQSGNGSVAAINPVTQQASVLYRGLPQARAGYMWSGDGTHQIPVAGGPADLQTIAARAAARRGDLPASPAPMPGAQNFYSYDAQGNPLP